MKKDKPERPQVNKSFALLLINSQHIYILHELFLYSFISDESFESILEIEREKLKVQKELLETKKQKLSLLKSQSQQRWEQAERTNKLLGDILLCLKQVPCLPDMSVSPVFKLD